MLRSPLQLASSNSAIAFKLLYLEILGKPLGAVNSSGNSEKEPAIQEEIGARVKRALEDT